MRFARPDAMVIAIALCLGIQGAREVRGQVNATAGNLPVSQPLGDFNLDLLDSGGAAIAGDGPGDTPPGNAAASDIGGLQNLSLEQLAQQDVVVPGLSEPVTTVERQPSTIGRTPAAVFVITPEMIRRTGARTIPDALRIAPGVDVARINAHNWAISIRGFNGRLANKLLVQIDGRVVYNTSQAGVWWDMQDVVLEDVARIEVVRGPGTTMWGSNAVNGVINIITKNTSETQGVLVQSGGGGQEQQDFNTVRYGGTLANGATYRVWGQQWDRAPGYSVDPANMNDAWHGQHGGFRIDYRPDDEYLMTFQGDLLNGYGGERNLIAMDTPPYSGFVSDEVSFPIGNVLFRYGRTIDDETSWQFQTYYSRFNHDSKPFIYDLQELYDIDLQYQFSPWERHQFITGANYRNSPTLINGGFYLNFDPPAYTVQWASVFAQDTIELEEDRWYFTIGTRLEWNTFGKFQPEPTARLLFLPSDRQSMWAAVSRAARNPTRGDTQISIMTHVGPPGVPTFINLQGNPDAEAENLVAYELGYRAAPTDYFTWDIAGYINDYNKLLARGPLGPPEIAPPDLVVFPFTFENNTRATTYGFETTASLQVDPRWRWFASYSFFQLFGTAPDPSTIPALAGSSPRNMVYLRSAMDLGNNVHWDVMGRYVDNLPALGVPSYFEMDTRVAWQATKSLEVSFVGQNLLQGNHFEFQSFNAPVATEVRRSWYGMVTWAF